jgi:hypothetical protein
MRSGRGAELSCWRPRQGRAAASDRGGPSPHLRREEVTAVKPLVVSDGQWPPRGALTIQVTGDARGSWSPHSLPPSHQRWVTWSWSDFLVSVAGAWPCSNSVHPRVRSGRALFSRTEMKGTKTRCWLSFCECGAVLERLSGESHLDRPGLGPLLRAERL